MHTLRSQVLRAHPDAVAALHRLQPRHGWKLARFGFLWAVGVGLQQLHPWLVPVGVALAAVGLLGNAILIHESAHGLFGSPRLNRFLGFVCGAPVLVSPTCFRLKHLHHHQHVGTDRDTTCLVANARKLGVPLPLVLLWVLGFGTLFVLPSLALGGWRLANPTQRRAIAREALGVVVLHGLFFTLVGPGVWLFAWLVPFVVASFAHNLRSVAEHTLTPREEPDRHGRSTVERGFVAWLHSNAGYHWEHHVFPGVPWYHLPALHRLLAPYRRERGVPTSPGYLAFVRREVVPFLSDPASWRRLDAP